jgi:hypothetical protein
MDNSTFRKLFVDNYYLSRDYAYLFSTILNKTLSAIKVGDGSYYSIGNKLVGIHPYTDAEAQELKAERIGFTRILNQDNSLSQNPSIREYNVIPFAAYESCRKNYQKHFRNQVNQSQRNNLKLSIMEKTDGNMSQAYEVYRKQIIRLNGWLFPLEMFSMMVKQRASRLYLLRCQDKVISYALIYETNRNMYLPLQGSLQEFFQLRPNNYIYDSLIKESCDKGKNLHLGSGIRGEGFERFKKEAGALQLSLEPYPRPTAAINLAARIWEQPAIKSIIGVGLRKLDGTAAYKRLIYSSMPMT